jgi:phosphoribosylformylglycinamidine synthase
LTFNDSQKFEARWIYLSAPRNVSVFAQGLPEKIYLPVAHGEGKFMVTDDKILDNLEANGQVVFKYVAPDNGPALYPWNPNGSSRDIAGLCDKTGRILGMMPHPERHSLPWQNPQWTRKGLRPEGDGLQLFKNAVEHVRRHIL